MTVTLFGIEFRDEADRDRALRELKDSLDRIATAERAAGSLRGTGEQPHD